MTLVDTHAHERPAGFPWRTILARCAPPLAGIAIIFAIWWLAGLGFEGSPRLAAFRGFTLQRTLVAFGQLFTSGDAWRSTAPSLSRVLQGLGWAFAIGVPTGLAIGSIAL